MSRHQVSLFNTLSREIEQLSPIEPGHVKLYCCGPTVYNFQHIGNLRTYIFEDFLARTLRYAGYRVSHVMNITDVGHLVSDADEGEDKMLVASKREGKTSREIAEYYTGIFFKDCEDLHITRPDVVCKATEHIPQMIEMIKRLEANGLAYFSDGNVYFDVAKFRDYGKLARLDLDNLQAGARIAVDSRKHSEFDFALWFTNSKFENQELQWDSPWGRGYPGWHIECSAMACNYLGDTFDIHCGGIDHIPVHHTNEIAQSEGASGNKFVNIWMHGGFLVTQSEKMSKSKGEFLTLERLREKGIDPMSYRLFCCSAHYRSELTWSWDALEASANTLRKIKNSVRELRANATPTTVEKLTARAQELLSQFQSAIFHDLGIPRAIATFHSILGDSTLPPAEKLCLLLEFDKVLGLGIAEWKEEALDIPEQVLRLMEQRKNARLNKDWKNSDELRAQILALGFIVEDSPSGQKIKKA